MIALVATHVERMKGIVIMMISVKKIISVELTTAEILVSIVLVTIILNLTVVTMKMKIFAQMTVHVE